MAHMVFGRSPMSSFSLPSGAAVVGGGADPSCPAAEMPGGGVEEARAGASRAGDPHPGARAQHNHSPALPGKAPRGEQAGQVPPQPPQSQGWEQDQLTFRY